MRRVCVLALIAPLLLSTLGAHEDNGSEDVLRIMEWNVENLFDTIDDEGFRDEEFLPQGERRWTSYRYWKKLSDISKVIVATADDGPLPAIIGLCEVENDSVLTALTRRSILRSLGYDYVMTHSNDARGVDVAMLYLPTCFRPLEQRDVRVPSADHDLPSTRDILYVKGLVRSHSQPAGVDTLHVVVVHLPSRLGGQQGNRNRALAAKTLWSLVDSIAATSVQTVPAIVLMGDFNAGGKDRIFKQSSLLLTDHPQALGTYCYRGVWQWIDHILISSSVVSSSPALPLSLPWLLEAPNSSGVQMPRRTFRGDTYHGGISDHLPLVLDLRLK